MYEMRTTPKGATNGKPYINGHRTRMINRRGGSYEDEAVVSEATSIITPLHFPFLKDIKKSDLQMINSRMVQQKFEKKEYIYLPYDYSEKVFFIIHGNVEIGYLDQSGRELSIDILATGDIFGSMIGRNFSLNSSEQTMTGSFARSVDKCVLGVLNRSDFENFIEKYPRFAAKIFKTMAGRINTLETKLQNLVFSDVKTRICKLLYSLFEKAGDKRTGQIKISLTHQDIANLVASSRETASLHLSELKKSGIIAYERKRIRILSLQSLQKST